MTGRGGRGGREQGSDRYSKLMIERLYDDEDSSTGSTFSLTFNTINYECPSEYQNTLQSIIECGTSLDTSS